MQALAASAGPAQPQQQLQHDQVLLAALAPLDGLLHPTLGALERPKCKENLGKNYENLRKNYNNN